MARHPALDPPEVEGPAPCPIAKERLGPPAGHRRRRCLIGPAEAQEQPGRPAGLGRELQPAAGQEIERFELDDDASHGRRAQRLVRRPENLPPVLAPNDEQPGSVDAEAGEAGAVEAALAPGEGRIRTPEKGTRLAQETAGEGCREPRSETAPHLVQRAERQPAPGQRRIDRGLARGGDGSPEATTATGEAANRRAQLGKGRRIGQGGHRSWLMFYYCSKPAGRRVKRLRAIFAATPRCSAGPSRNACATLDDKSAIERPNP